MVNLCRFLLAGVFIFSGFVKAVDPLGSFYKIQDYLTAFGLHEWIPVYASLFGAVLLAGIEFCVGIFLFLGIRRRIASSLALLLLVIMTPLTLYLAIANPVHDCGCFGDAIALTNWQTFAKNVVLLAASIVIFKQWKTLARFVTLKMEWMVSMYTIVFAFAISFYCLRHLPILDFRPYKIGTNLAETKRMADADEGEATLKSLFIHDFYMFDRQTGEDLTDSILNNKNYTFILIAHRIEEADDSNIDLINEIYDYSKERGYDFCALTSSTTEAIEQWCERTGAEYPFYESDDIALKTVIRSNPGLLLLKDGVILNKWSSTDLPDEYEMNGPLDTLEVGKLQTVNNVHTLLRVLLCFIGPLALIIVLDILFVKRKTRTKLLKQK